MEIRFIENKTQFDINFLGDNLSSIIKMTGILHEIKHDTSLLLEGDELYEYCMNQPHHGLRLSLVFFRGSKKYLFYGKVERTLTKYGVKLTEVTATTGIEEKNRRSTPRFSITADVKLYLQKANSSLELICSGQTHDISCDAICFLTNSNINLPDNSKFYIEFTIFGNNNFNLPVKLLRKGNAPQSVRFKYDYAFAFDFFENQDEKGRLIDSFFKNSLKSRYS